VDLRGGAAIAPPQLFQGLSSGHAQPVASCAFVQIRVDRGYLFNSRQLGAPSWQAELVELRPLAVILIFRSEPQLSRSRGLQQSSQIRYGRLHVGPLL
jgi:hypothetical protein